MLLLTHALLALTRPRHQGEAGPGGYRLCWTCACSAARGGPARSRHTQWTHETASAVMEAAGFEPLVSYPGAGKPWRSLCTRCGTVRTPTLNNVYSKGTGCGPCSTRTRRAAALAAEAPAAIADMEADGLTPLEDYPGSRVPWRCLCQGCGEERTPMLCNVRAGHHGCQPCTARSKAAAMLAAGAPRAIADMHAVWLEPLDPYPGTTKRWKSRCLVCDRTVSPMLGNIRRGQGPCEYCAGTVRLDPVAAAAVMREAGFEPLSDYPGANQPWTCRCLTCGSVRGRRLSHVRNGIGCRDCAGLAPTDPHQAASEMRYRGFEPLIPFPGLGEPWHSQCLNCDNEVHPRLNNLRNRPGRGCWYCAKRGLDPAVPALLYVMTHPGHCAVKIGITGTHVRPSRVQDHERYGWKLHETMALPTGRDAYRTEQLVLRWLEARGLRPFLTATQMPQSGWTETFCEDHVTALEVWQMARKASGLRAIKA